MKQEFTQEELNKIYKAIKGNITFDGDRITLGNILELKLHEEGEFLDVYKYAEEKDMEDDEYDFDEDFIGSVYLK